MAAWPEVKAHILETFKGGKDLDKAVELVWRFPGPNGEIAQAIRVSQVEIERQPWLFILADIGGENALNLRSAIAYQDHLGYGALVLRKGTFILRHSLPLEGLPWAEVDRAVRMVARDAGRLRKAILGPGPREDPGMFQTYDD
jgi:hypothetical protein